MKLPLVCVLCLIALGLCSCAKRVDKISDIPNGKYKLQIRDSEYGGDGTHYIDICVAEARSTEFSTSGDRCFLRGFDFGSISAKWVSDRNVIITFRCGYLTAYTNTASLEGRDNPDQFNAKLVDTCSTYHWAL
jgi:hypothetical protein